MKITTLKFMIEYDEDSYLAFRVKERESKQAEVLINSAYNDWLADIKNTCNLTVEQHIRNVLNENGIEFTITTWKETE